LWSFLLFVQFEIGTWSANERKKRKYDKGLHLNERLPEGWALQNRFVGVIRLFSFAFIRGQCFFCV